MRSPVETVKGRIVGYDERRGELLIRAPYADWHTMTKREYSQVLVQPIDGRPLSDKQRKMCYALLRAISDYCGQDIHSTKEYLKIRFLADDLGETADKIFSLSNAPMSLVAAYQRYLVRFILEFDIPCDFSLLDHVDDVMDYTALPLLGIVPEDQNVTLAAAYEHPLLYFRPRSGAAQACRRIADRIQGIPVPMKIR